MLLFAAPFSISASPSPAIYRVAQPETAASELTPSQLPGKHNWTHRHSASTQLNPSLQLTTANNCVYSFRTRQLEPKHTLLIGHSTEMSTWWHTRWVTLRWHQQLCLPVPGNNHTEQTQGTANNSHPAWTQCWAVSRSKNHGIVKVGKKHWDIGSNHQPSPSATSNSSKGKQVVQGKDL